VRDDGFFIFEDDLNPLPKFRSNSTPQFHNDTRHEGDPVTSHKVTNEVMMMSKMDSLGSPLGVGGFLHRQRQSEQQLQFKIPHDPASRSGHHDDIAAHPKEEEGEGGNGGVSDCPLVSPLSIVRSMGGELGGGLFSWMWYLCIRCLASSGSLTSLSFSSGLYWGPLDFFLVLEAKGGSRDILKEGGLGLLSKTFFSFFFLCSFSVLFLLLAAHVEEIWSLWLAAVYAMGR